MRFTISWVGAAVLYFACTTSPVFAGTYDFLRDEYIEEGSNHYDAMLEAKAALEEKDPDLWFNTEIQEYLSESAWTVYCGLVAYTFDKGNLPSKIDAEALESYIEGWPENPYTDWAPMEVLTTEDKFSPGNMVWQIAPREAWSLDRNVVDGECPMSFELSIYGPTLVSAYLGNAETHERNTWAIVPKGSLFMLHVFSESAEDTRKKRR